MPQFHETSDSSHAPKRSGAALRSAAVLGLGLVVLLSVAEVPFADSMSRDARTREVYANLTAVQTSAALYPAAWAAASLAKHSSGSVTS